MKKSIFSLLAVASFVLFANTTNAQSKAKASVENVVHTYFDALNASDANKVVSLFTTDGVLLAAGAPTATGTEQLKGTFKYVFDNFTYTLEETVGEVTVKGNHAIVRSTSKGTFVIKASGQKVEDEFRELFVLQKVKGDWKIARYMYNRSK